MNDASGAICLEGSAGCGKTTCSGDIADAWNGMLLPEYTETLDSEHRSYLMSSYDRNAEDDEAHVWRHAEGRRAELATQGRGRSVVLDTSLVSVVAFVRARRKFGQGGNVATIVRGYLDLLSRDELVLPNRIIHLRVSEDVRQRRLAIRGNCHPFLLRQDVSAYLDDIRMEFFERYLPSGSWASIDTSELSRTAATAQVVRELDGMKAQQTSDALAAWLSAVPCQ